MGLDNRTTYIIRPECISTAKKTSLTIVNVYIALHYKGQNKKGTTGQWDQTVGPEDGSTYIMGPAQSTAAKIQSLKIVNFYIALHHKNKNIKGTMGWDSRTGQQGGTMGRYNKTAYIIGPKHIPTAKKLSLTIVNVYIALHYESLNKKRTTGQDSRTRQ